MPNPIEHRPTSLAQEVRRADPQWNRDSKVSPEYEFSSGKRFERRNAKFLPYLPDEELEDDQLA